MRRRRSGGGGRGGAGAVAALLAVAACGGDEPRANPLAPIGDGSGGGGPAPGVSGGGAGGGADCFTNPKTHYEIINACTDAVRVKKAPNLRGLAADGGLPPLP
jgi:hypothetical protein